MLKYSYVILPIDIKIGQKLTKSEKKNLSFDF